MCIFCCSIGNGEGIGASNPGRDGAAPTETSGRAGTWCKLNWHDVA
jgi:hypothetical protein